MLFLCRAPGLAFLLTMIQNDMTYKWTKTSFHSFYFHIRISPVSYQHCQHQPSISWKLGLFETKRPAFRRQSVSHFLIQHVGAKHMLSLALLWGSTQQLCSCCVLYSVWGLPTSEEVVWERRQCYNQQVKQDIRCWNNWNTKIWQTRPFTLALLSVLNIFLNILHCS